MLADWSNSDDNDGMALPKKIVSNDKVCKEKAKFFKRSFRDKFKYSKFSTMANNDSTTVVGVSCSSLKREALSGIANEDRIRDGANGNTSSSDESGGRIAIDATSGTYCSRKMKKRTKKGRPKLRIPATFHAHVPGGFPPPPEIDSGSGTPVDDSKSTSSSTNSSGSLVPTTHVRSLFDGLSHLYMTNADPRNKSYFKDASLASLPLMSYYKGVEMNSAPGSTMVDSEVLKEHKTTTVIDCVKTPPQALTDSRFTWHSNREEITSDGGGFHGKNLLPTRIKYYEAVFFILFYCDTHHLSSHRQSTDQQCIHPIQHALAHSLTPV